MKKKIYNRLLKERMSEIQKISDKIYYDDLIIYYVKGRSSSVNFIEHDDPSDLYDKTIQAAEEEQKQFKSSLGQISSGDPECKSHIQSNAIKNVKSVYNSRQKIIDLFNDNVKIRSEAIYEGKQNETKGKGLKILTPKQMFQRLPIALAQVKAGNNSESLLNEIRQIVYSLYQSKQITKKVYNNIIKSIQWNCTQL